MSGGYAERLTFRPPEMLGGKLGEAEKFDSDQVLRAQVSELAQWIRQSKRGVTVFTGAGISTACGIPDFRGPNGIWTLQSQGKPLPKVQIDFELAKPSLTHMALVALVKSEVVKHICSQNVDGLHLRSGVPPEKLSELHGDCFVEKCHRCKKSYHRDFEMKTVGFKYTGRRCTTEGCRGRLKDFVLDWDDALPEDDLIKSERNARESDVALCLGTSLRIAPACNIPPLTKKHGGKLVIINLQKTPKDKQADMKIHGKSDIIMKLLMQHLSLSIPPFVRKDRLRYGHLCKLASKKRKLGTKVYQIKVFVTSIHGQELPIPWIESCSGTISTPSGECIHFTDFCTTFQCRDEGRFSVSWTIKVKPELNPPRNTITFEHSFTIDDQQSPPQSMEKQEELEVITSMHDVCAAVQEEGICKKEEED